MRLPGWRTLVEGDCAACGHRYLQDLPSGHGLVYPTTLDLDTGETLDPAGAKWFSSWLRPAWEQPDGRPVGFAVEVGQEQTPTALVNCLDPVYGHSLLKLLGSGCTPAPVVLIPRALAGMVPAWVSETWIVDEPVGRFRGWLLDLEERLLNELERFPHLDLAPVRPHPHPSTYVLEDFVAGVDPERIGEPSLVLSLRDDRPWGGTEEEQRARAAGLWSVLERAVPHAGAAVVGPGRPGGLPDRILDARHPAPTGADERRWLALMRGADLAIGVHGSNLLLPSGLAAATVELLPAERYGNIFQDALVTDADPVLALYRHRTIYGDADLHDVSPEVVAAVALSVLEGRERFRKLMTGPAAVQDSGHVEPIPASADPPPAEGPPAGPNAARRAISVVAATGADVATRLGRRSQRERPYRGPLPVVMRDSRGLSFELVSREEATAFADHSGHFENGELDMIDRYLAVSMTALDVGANIGMFTAVLGRGVGPTGVVHAFEPHGPSRERLRRTLELNGLAHVVVNAAAVSANEGGATLALYGPGYESWATLRPRAIDLEGGTLTPSGESAVSTVTLDSYCDRVGIEHVDVLKIDVEGAEPLVLEGARGLLESGAVDLLVIEVSDNTLAGSGTSAHQLVVALEERGLRPHVVREGRLQPMRIAGPYPHLANVVAASSKGLERLRDLGLAG